MKNPQMARKRSTRLKIVFLLTEMRSNTEPQMHLSVTLRTRKQMYRFRYGFFSIQISYVKSYVGKTVIIHGKTLGVPETAAQYFTSKISHTTLGLRNLDAASQGFRDVCTAYSLGNKQWVLEILQTSLLAKKLFMQPIPVGKSGTWQNVTVQLSGQLVTCALKVDKAEYRGQPCWYCTERKRSYGNR